MKIELCSDTKLTIIASLGILAFFGTIALGVWWNEQSWRMAVEKGLQQKQAVGTSGYYWSK